LVEARVLIGPAGFGRAISAIPIGTKADIDLGLLHARSHFANTDFKQWF
jgi:hypothetical protein